MLEIIGNVRYLRFGDTINFRDDGSGNLLARIKMCSLWIVIF